jgi:hypothetical protein
MAIQVAGTNIITNAKALNGITSIDSTTASAISSGGVGAPTTYNSVGSYAFAAHTTARLSTGDTTSGSNLRAGSLSTFSSPPSSSIYLWAESSSSLSGTWRCMSQHGQSSTETSPYYVSTFGVYVRIS